MSNQDRDRILRMVAAGDLSAEEAAELLDAVAPESRAARTPPPPPEPVHPSSPVNGRSLIMLVTEEGENRVNVRIPLSLARAAGRFIPRQAQRHLAEYGINIEELLADMGSSLQKGPLIEVQDGEDRVVIAVE